ncbi:hypothetical protein M758_6G162000 [Ceratodon purpureus]|nr:hypothetical protein M758_6G162000 [Ceratodon purpureus]
MRIPVALAPRHSDAVEVSPLQLHLSTQSTQCNLLRGMPPTIFMAEGFARWNCPSSQTSKNIKPSTICLGMILLRRLKA